MVAVHKKVAPSRRGMDAHAYADAMARHNAHWDHIPAAYREIPEGEDPHEFLDKLSDQETHDRRAFQQGEAAPCPFTQMLQQEDEEDQQFDS
jgi:hypothetical protein